VLNLAPILPGNDNNNQDHRHLGKGIRGGRKVRGKDGGGGGCSGAIGGREGAPSAVAQLKNPLSSREPLLPASPLHHPRVTHDDADNFHHFPSSPLRHHYRSTNSAVDGGNPGGGSGGEGGEEEAAAALSGVLTPPYVLQVR
jgi:hypothetical protein